MISAGCCHCGTAPEKDMAVQLYSARDLIGSAELYAQNHEQVLKAIAEMGYTGVEAANFKNGLFYGVTPEQFKADVEAAGMEVVASHTNRKLSAEELASGDLTEALAWWDAALPAHKAAGMRYVVVPSMTMPETLKDLKLTCDYFNEIGRRCKAAGMDFGFHNHSREFKKVADVVIIDYLGLMQGDHHTDNRVQEISEITRSLKILAKELMVPVICCAQLSRGPEGRQGNKPMLSDLRDSGAIEQDADTVIFLYRSEYYDSEANDEEGNIAEVIIAKNRHGSTGTVKMGWIGRFTKFRTIADESQLLQ